MELKINYSSVGSVEEDKDCIRIKPLIGNKKFLKEEIIPKNSIARGDLNNFVNALKDKISTVKGTEKVSKADETFLLKYKVDINSCDDKYNSTMG